MAGITVTPVTKSVGARIHGVDLRQGLSPDAVRAIREAWLDHGVLFFKDQELSDEQLHGFIRQFGEPFDFSYDGSATRVVSQADMGPAKPYTSVWHADMTWAARPPLAGALRAVQLPSVGGDTCWASMVAAYEALSEPFRRMLDGLTAIHRSQSAASKQNAHPVVRVHPETGRKALYVNEISTVRIVELSAAESAYVLATLFDHIRSPDFSLRWHWAVNDVAFWDNRAVQHYAVPDYSEPRIMQRAELSGEVPIGPSAR